MTRGLVAGFDSIPTVSEMGATSAVSATTVSTAVTAAGFEAVRLEADGLAVSALAEATLEVAGLVVTAFSAGALEAARLGTPAPVAVLAAARFDDFLVGAVCSSSSKSGCWAGSVIINKVRDCYTAGAFHRAAGTKKIEEA